MACFYKNITGDTLIKDGAGKLRGIFVASASGGRDITVYDAVSAAAPLLINTFTPAAATYYPMPEDGVTFTRGLYFDVSATLDITVFYE